MAEPPSKRRRSDSRQMWDSSDRHAPLPSRERDEPPVRDRGRRDDRDRDRDQRRYRSRSPRDPKGRDDRDDYRNLGREERGGRNSRGGRRDDEGKDPRDYRDRPRERSRDRDRGRDRDRRRSRSPRRDKEREWNRDGGERDREGTRNRGSEKETSRGLRADHTDDIPDRSATPPVSFKVGGTPQPYEDEKMDVDATSSKSKKKNAGRGGKKNKAEAEPTEDDDVAIEDDGMAAMKAMMGFGGFGTTQQKKVLGNDVYAVRKEKKTEYRQYMNRVGGFNRPLSPGRE